MNQLKYLILALSFFISIGKVNAQWQSTMFPTNGIVYSLVTNGNNIVAGVDASFGGFGVYQLGANWSSTSLVPNNRISAVLADGMDLIAAGYIDAGVFFSHDNGLTWSQTYAGIPTTFIGQVPNIHALAKNNSFVFVGCDSGVFKTNNSGTNWTAAGLSNLEVRSITISGSNIFAGTYGNGAYLSNNNGSSWTAINTGLTDTVINTIAISGNNIFAGTDKGIFLSNNHGSSWNLVNNGMPIVNVYAIAIKGSFIIAGTANQIFVSSDNGNTWTASNSGLFSNDFFSLTTRGNTVYAGANGSGVFSRPITEMTNCFAYNSTTYDSTLNAFTINIDSVTSAMAVSYHWDFGDGTTSSLATPTHTYAVDSLYNVCMTIYNSSGDSCTTCHIIGKDAQGNIILRKNTSGFTLNVHNASTSISENLFKDSKISIYPNPFTVETKLSFTEFQKNSTVLLLDALGKIIRTDIFSGNEFIIEKGDISSGIYILKITNENNKTVLKKIIIN